MARGETEPPVLTREEKIEGWGKSAITNEVGFAVLVASRRMTEDLRRRDDWETLLRTSRELWGDAPQEQGIQCNPWAEWQCTVATELRFGRKLDTFEGFTGNFGTAVMRLVGAHVDTRDAETIAEEYLERGREALREVMPRYAARVAEKVLDLEEARADDGTAESLRAERDERRGQLLQAFRGKPAARGR